MSSSQVDSTNAFSRGRRSRVCRASRWRVMVPWDMPVDRWSMAVTVVQSSSEAGSVPTWQMRQNAYSEETFACRAE